MTDAIVEFCKAHNLLLDRETYIAIAYPDGTPDPWTTEHEIELPREFRWNGLGLFPKEP